MLHLNERFLQTYRGWGHLFGKVNFAMSRFVAFVVLVQDSILVYLQVNLANQAIDYHVWC